MKKRIMALILALIMAVGMTGCMSTEDAARGGYKPSEPVLDDEDVKIDFDVEDVSFDESFAKYMSEAYDGTYMWSPVSLRAAMTLAAEGASGGTLEQMLAAMGCESLEDAEAWYQDILNQIALFSEDLDWYDEHAGQPSDMAFSIANSVWSNEDALGSFRDDYIAAVRDKFDAQARTVKEDLLTGEVNDWVSEKTNGMIPFIVDDVSQAEAVLANALYLKAAWSDPFEPDLTESGIFHGKDGGTEVLYMQRMDRMNYLKQGNAEYLVLPLWGGISMVVALGADDALIESTSDFDYREVHVKLPKFEFSTTADADILMGYLRAIGVSDAFSWEDADFSAMSDTPWYIDSIVQKSKIGIDEDGLEAAAATAITMDLAAAAPEQEEPVEFIVDRPFTFAIYSGLWEDNPTLLFTGRVTDIE